MKRILALLSLLPGIPVLLWAGGAAESELLHSFRYDGVEAVEILDGAIYSVQVTGGAGSALEAQVYAPRGTSVGVEHRRTGSTVQLRTYRRGRLFGSPGGRHEIVLRVPRDCALSIRTATGSVAVSDVNGGKSLRTDTGAIELRDSQGNVVAESNTGAHSYEGIRGNLDARTDTGSVTIVGLTGALHVSTDTGRIEAGDVRLTGDCSLESDTGSIQVELDQRLEEFRFDVRSDTGSIAVGATSARGRLLTGEGALSFTARSDTGSITISGPR